MRSVEHPIVYLNEWGARKPEEILNNGLQKLSVLATDARLGGFLLLDQFEDVFKLDADRSGLWDTLAETVNGDQNDIGVIVTMREECRFLSIRQSRMGSLPP